jgi:hypothetical protein
MATTDFTRVLVELMISSKVSVINDYAIGEFIANRTFFDRMNEIQEAMHTTEVVVTESGNVLDMTTQGGMVGLSMYLESLNQRHTTMLGLSKLGLNVEKQVWKNI